MPPSGTAFGLVGLLALPFALLPLLADRGDADASTGSGPAPAGIKEATTIVYFAFLAFLYVGIEASVGNWMSTYATRATAWTLRREQLGGRRLLGGLVAGPGDHTRSVGLDAGTPPLSSLLSSLP